MRLLFASGIWALTTAAPSASSSSSSGSSAFLSTLQQPATVSSSSERAVWLRKEVDGSQSSSVASDPSSHHHFSVPHYNNNPTTRSASGHHDNKVPLRIQHHHTSDNNNSTPNDDEPLLFCDNSMPMTMFMDGFRSSLFALETMENDKSNVEPKKLGDGSRTTSPPTPPPPCLQYLWGQWNLTSRSRFGWAFVASFALAVAFEALAALRCHLPSLLFRWEDDVVGSQNDDSPPSAPTQSTSPRRPHFVSVRVIATLHYAFQALLGYLIMLVVMSYSPELLFGVVLGLMVGHAAFFATTTNAGGTTAAPTTATADALATTSVPSSYLSSAMAPDGPRTLQQHDDHPNHSHDDDLPSRGDFAALCQPLLANDAHSSSSFSTPSVSSFVV